MRSKAADASFVRIVAAHSDPLSCLKSSLAFALAGLVCETCVTVWADHPLFVHA
jgi:hypothetical protein